MSEIERLSDMEIGERAVVRELLSDESIRRRLLDMGMIEGTVVECVGKSPAKDPCEYLVRGAVIAIRIKDGDKVLIERGEALWD